MVFWIYSARRPVRSAAGSSRAAQAAMNQSVRRVFKKSLHQTVNFAAVAEVGNMLLQAMLMNVPGAEQPTSDSSVPLLSVNTNMTYGYSLCG